MQFTDSLPTQQRDRVLKLGELFSWPSPITPNNTWLRANMVAAIDGGAVGSNHSSDVFNDTLDQLIMTVLRATSDVLLVGAGTIRAEGYEGWHEDEHLLRVCEILGTTPPTKLAIITNSGNLSAGHLASKDAIVLTSDAGAERLWVNPNVTAEVIATGESVDLHQAIGALQQRGYQKILSEGGPGLLGDLIAAGLTNELCVRTAPLILGGETKRIVETDEWLEKEATLTHLIHENSNLYALWELATGQSAG